MDLWPFLINLRKSGSTISAKQISDDVNAALQICRWSSPSHRQSSRRTGFTLSDQTVLLCCLLPHLSRWLERPDLLGSFAMVTTERYGVALQCVAYYLLQLPKATLAEISKSRGSIGSVLPSTPDLRLIRKVLPIFLSRSSPSTDIYFPVMLTFPPITPFLGTAHDRSKLVIYIERVSILFANMVDFLRIQFVIPLIIIFFIYSPNINRHAAIFLSSTTRRLQTISRPRKRLNKL